jgi:hypothetical protein
MKVTDILDERQESGSKTLRGKKQEPGSKMSKIKKQDVRK